MHTFFGLFIILRCEFGLMSFCLCLDIANKEKTLIAIVSLHKLSEISENFDACYSNYIKILVLQLFTFIYYQKKEQLFIVFI